MKPNGYHPKTAAITGVYGYLPDFVLTNAELARMVDTSDAWITERTGIKERRILKGEGLGTSHMGAEAVKGLLKRTETDPSEIDLLICATTTPDMVFPSTANMIADMVGLGPVGSFDVQAACSGFIYAVSIATQFIATGQCRKVVVVGADKMSTVIDFRRRRRRGSGRTVTERRGHPRHADPLRRIRHDPSASEGGRQPPSAERRNRRQADALCLSGRCRGL
jgi:3-oxoacyl-(acyl-carrier-protein) synthase III